MKKGLSLRTKILLFFMAVMVLTVVLFLTINRVFWKQYYMSKNQDYMMSAYTGICEIMQNPRTSQNDLITAVSALRLVNIEAALQGDEDWDFMVATKQNLSEVEREFLLERLQQNLLFGSLAEEDKTIIESGENYTLQQVSIPKKGTYLECFGYMLNYNGEEKKFILSMPMEKLMSAFSESNLFFMYFSIGLVLILGVILWFLCNRITRPLRQLTNLSVQMSRMDFSARYTGNNRDEIGVLGDNMNEMASQLERSIKQLQVANEQLMTDLEEKKQVDEMRTDFISNVSHELKTPLALISGYAEGLKEIDKADQESMEYYCDVIMDETSKMTRMVRELTVLNQLEFGNDLLEEESFDIMDMIHGLVYNSKKMQEEHHAKVMIQGPRHAEVYADQFKIEEVLKNYYSNAFNHLEAPNQITFTYDDLGPLIRISVKNTGELIPEEELSKVWVKFYKVDKARTRAYGGSGIGLSIVKTIMDSHKTECGCYNEQDGVVFWFELYKEKSENGKA